MKTFYAITLVMFMCAASFGQSVYKGLKPGQSTRSDVERALGQPVRQISERLFEYSKEGKQVYVQYSKESPTAIRIQLVYPTPATRSDVLSSERLPQVADTRRTNKKGALEEYFGNPKYIVLTYTDNSPNQVSQVGYYSRQLFESAIPELSTSAASPSPEARPADIPSINANIISLRFFESSRTYAPPYGQREYKTRFANSQTRFVNYEISLQHPAPGRVVPLSVNSLWRIDRTGTLLRNQVDDWIRIPADWTSSVFNTGTGNTDPGQWEVGTYTVELYVEGRKVAEGKFEIY